MTCAFREHFVRDEHFVVVVTSTGHPTAAFAAFAESGAFVDAVASIDIGALIAVAPIIAVDSDCLCSSANAVTFVIAVVINRTMAFGSVIELAAELVDFRHL